MRRGDALRRSRDGPHGHQIRISDRSYVRSLERHERGRATGGCNELDLKAVGRVSLDDRTEIASPKTMLRDIVNEDHRIEQFVSHGYLGYTVTSRGTSSPTLTIQTDTTAAERPCGPVRVPETKYLRPCTLSSTN